MDASFGRRVREQRKQKGWTIETLAACVGVSTNYMGDLERGVKSPSLGTFIRIVEALNISADILIRDTVAPASHIADDEIGKMMKNLTPEQKKAAVDILNAYQSICETAHKTG